MSTTPKSQDGLIPPDTTTDVSISIEAAGGVVLRGNGEATEVLVVHRAHYDDWSLPKGKLDAGEDAATAALREVAEETGVAADLGEELPSMIYLVGAAHKRVRWFRMSPSSGDPTLRAADGEVDIARWVQVQDAAHLLTYGPDRRLLEHTVDQGRRT